MLTPPVLRHLGNRTYELAEPLTYSWHALGAERSITVPAGFRCDLASIPRFLWALIAPDDLCFAAIIHDWLFRHGGAPAPSYVVDGEVVDAPWTQFDADRLFARIMRDGGVARWRRRAAYRAVRLFGSRAWRGSK